jgi:radical SAM protein with 4Fe4S-binding SPASM domain
MAGSPLPMIEYRDFSLKVYREAGQQDRVISAQIELTYGCNLHCVHCYTDCYNWPDLIRREMSFDQIKDILDQLSDQGCLWVCFTGGEIFVRKDFFDIYAYARQKGFLITLFTNGTLITESIADYLKQHPPFCIEISCHAATEETFDRITQVRGSFQRFLKGIRFLVERGLPIKFKTKGMTLNKHELEQIKALIEGFGARFQLNNAIYPRLNGDLTPTRYRLSPEEIVEIEHSGSDVDEVSCHAGEQAGLGPPPDDRLFRCGCGTTSVHINAWGKLGTCTWVNEPRADLTRTSVAAGIAQVFPQIRAARYRSDTACRTCRVHALCDKMPANAGAETGDPEQPVDHFCQVAYKRADVMGIKDERPLGQ